MPARCAIYRWTQPPPLASPVPTKTAAVVSMTGAGTMAIISTAGAEAATRAGAGPAARITVAAGTNDFTATMALNAVRIDAAVRRAGLVMEASEVRCEE
jgi:hypothetical protein